MIAPLVTMRPQIADDARLRILHVGKYYPPAPGGMERVVQLLCEHERPAADSRVLACNTAARTVTERWNGVPVTRVARLGAIGSVGVCPAFPLAWRRLEADLVVLHEPNPLALVADLVGGQRGPLVVWYHSEVLRPAWKYRLMYQPFLRRVLDRAARIVVSSPALAEHAAALRPYRDKCRVVPFGIDVDTLAATPEIAARAAAIRTAHPGPIVLFVGRLVPYKGVSVLLEAMSDVPATTVIVGRGPLEGTLKAQAGRSGSGNRVVFAGDVDDAELLALYHACDVFVLPSITKAEAFGMVQLEAMGCGKPVISTDLPSGVPWVNRHGTSGLVVPPNDAAALGEAIRSLLADDLARTTLGAGARTRVRQEFGAARMAQRTVALYREVLGR